MQNIFGRGLQFVADMHLRNADARMDAGAAGTLQGGGGGPNVLFHRPGQAADSRAAHGGGHSLHRLEIAGAGDGKTGLDDVHAQFFERQSDLDFLSGIEFATGYLFAVAEGGVEDLDAGSGHNYRRFVPGKVIG